MENTFDILSHAKILIVDDDPMMRLLMRESLENEHYSIEETEDGESALESISNDPPDIVLLDVKMPGMSGFDVCSEIRKKHDRNSISIVVVTGLDDSESIEHAFELGATAFINKPINPVTFPYRIQYLLSARNTFLELKQRETHLEYMDRISRIFTHKKNLNAILQETLEEMLAIFKANQALLFKANTTNKNNLELVTCSPNISTADKQAYNSKPFDHIPISTFVQARISEYPVASSLEASSAEPAKQLMMKAIYLNNNECWYIVLQRPSAHSPWPAIYKETFYRISTRLNSVLENHLLLQQLHENEALLKQAQQIGKLGNWSINVKTGKLYWSDEIFHIYGFQPGSFIPDINKLQKHIVKDDRERVSQFEQNAFFSGVTESIEYRVKLKDNHIRWVHKQGIGKFDSNGNIIAINGTLQDITERILKQEQELHEHKMDAVGQLTSGVAHDFGNLMTIAKGNLEMLDETFISRYRLNDDDIEIINDAKSAIRDGADLTKQLLAFSRKKSISPENLNIQNAIDKFQHLFTKTLGDTITLRIKLQNNLPEIFVDASQFESSLLNAIINAKHSMPNGGNLTIHAKQHQHLPLNLENKIESPLAENYICISIADTGNGMSADVLKRATEPFFTTKKSEGTGLGLSMIYGFMRQSNGILNIESKINKGTCLLMFFPASTEAIKQTTHTLENTFSLPQESKNLNTKTILVVDDREAVRRFAIRCMDDLTVNILQADNAHHAIEVLNDNDNVDILFSDILMPGDMNGRGLARWVKQNRPEIKILLTTASELENEKSAHAPEHNFQILPKPYSQHELLLHITTLL